MEKIYAKGLFAKRNEKAPEFVICGLSVKTDDFIQFLKENTNEKGYVNLQVLRNVKRFIYVTVTAKKPNTASTEIKKAIKTQENDPFQNGNSGDLPF